MNPTSTYQPSLPRRLRIIEFLRVSTDHQDVERQRADLDYIKRTHPVEVVRTLQLKGVSGTAVLKEEEIHRLLRDMESPDIDGISLSAIDRLTRPKRFSDNMIFDPFADWKKTIFSAREGRVEPWTAQGYATCCAAGTAAGMELRELHRRSKGGRDHKHAMGKLTSGAVPFGYNYVDKREKDGQRMVIHEPNAKVVRAMYDWIDQEGISPYKVAARLNEKGILSPGKPGQYEPGLWSRSVARQLLQKSSYKGVHMVAGVAIPCPAIVTPEQWERVQRSMTSNGGGKWEGRPSTIYLLRQMLFCGRCDHCCHGRQSRGRFYYICGNHTNKGPYKSLCDAPFVRIEPIERTAWGALWDMITDPARLLRCGNAYYDAQAKGKPSGAADKLAAELKRLQTQAGNWRQMIEDGLKNYGDYREKLSANARRCGEIEAELHSAGRVVSMPTKVQAEAAVRLIQANEPTTYEGRRAILEKLLDLKIVYRDQKNELVITGKVPVPAAASKNRQRGVDAAASSFTAFPFEIRRAVA
jgi:DNA invertase Pin-like site-specific DNA recombinase